MQEIRIVSGGQTGADRAALDFAIEHGFDHGGWWPKGRVAEDGPIPKRYRLQETSTSDYPQRTETNIRDSDGTVIFTIKPSLSGGSLKTARLAQKLGKPCLYLSRTRWPQGAETELRRFIKTHRIKVLNVAGSRASKEPAIGMFVRHVLGTLVLNETIEHRFPTKPPSTTRVPVTTNSTQTRPFPNLRASLNGSE